MINPVFKQYLDIDEGGKITIEKPPADFKVLYYATFASYTLVSWELSFGEESIGGENLWHGFTPIATGGGALDLYIEEVSNKGTGKVSGVILSVEGRSSLLDTGSLGKLGIPKRVALALRDPNNKIYLNL